MSIPTKLPDSVRLLVNIQQEHFGFPALALAKVCHSYQFDEIQCRAGFEFVTKELADRMFSPYQMSEMPPILFTYTNARREVLNHAVKEWDAIINNREDTGVGHEDE